MKDYRFELAKVQSSIIIDFAKLIAEYGTDNVLYMEGIHNMFVEDSPIIDYRLEETTDEKHVKVVCNWRNENGEIITDRLDEYPFEQLVPMFESAYLFLLLSIYNISSKRKDHLITFNSIEKFIKKNSGISATFKIDSPEDAELLSDISDLAAIGDFLGCIIDDDEEIDILNDVDDEQYDDEDDDFFEIVTLSVEKDKDKEVCFHLSSKNGLYNEMYIRIATLSTLQIMHYFNLIYQNQTSLLK